MSLLAKLYKDQEEERIDMMVRHDEEWRLMQELFRAEEAGRGSSTPEMETRQDRDVTDFRTRAGQEIRDLANKYEVKLNSAKVTPESPAQALDAAERRELEALRQQQQRAAEKQEAELDDRFREALKDEHRWNAEDITRDSEAERREAEQALNDQLISETDAMESAAEQREAERREAERQRIEAMLKHNAAEIARKGQEGFSL